MSLVLTLKSPDEEPREVSFDKATVVAGSDSLCDLVVEGEGVDARQAVFIPRESHVDVFDIGVSGGILVNGARLTHAELKPTDEVWLGGMSVHASLPGEAETRIAIMEMPATVRAEEGAAPIGEPEPWASDNRFALLDRVRKLMNSIGTDQNIFESILDVLFDVVPVRRGFLALTDDDGGLKIRATRNDETDGDANEAITVSRTLLSKVVDSGSAVLTSDAEQDPELSLAQSIHKLRIRAATAVPLKVEGKVIGIAYGDNRERPGALNKEHLSILNALASVAAVAVEKMRLLEEFEVKQQIQQSLRIARGIQRNFLPSGPPEVPGLDVAGMSESCDETGGDYFDYFPHDDGRLSVVIADVTGHGVGSALLMATTRAAMKALLGVTESLSQLFFELNNLISADLQDGRFVTGFMSTYDPTDRTLVHVGAGHTPPIVYRAETGRTETLTCHAPPLGIFEGIDFAAGEPVTLQVGDVVILMTDGLMEAMRADGEMFGMERLERAVMESASRPAEEIVATLSRVVDEWTGGEELRDDATVVVFKVTA